MREFETGATRDTNTGKPEYGGFLSPVVLLRYGQYMHKHREQADGKLRDSDNWQKGIPVRVYLESLLRHVMDIWLHILKFRHFATEDYQEALCAAMFNIQGLLFEELREGAVLVQPKSNAEWQKGYDGGYAEYCGCGGCAGPDDG